MTIFTTYVPLLFGVSRLHVLHFSLEEGEKGEGVLG